MKSKLLITFLIALVLLPLAVACGGDDHGDQDEHETTSHSDDDHENHEGCNLQVGEEDGDVSLSATADEGNLGTITGNSVLEGAGDLFGNPWFIIVVILLALAIIGVWYFYSKK
jgi:hypothetical protein